ncbi:MAG: DUF3313 domain-containing protein [Verrucomicrobiales bacterium]
MKFVALPKCILAVAIAGSVSCKAIKSKNESFLTNYRGFEQNSRWNDAISYEGDLRKLRNYDRVYIETVQVIPQENPNKIDLTRNATLEEYERLQREFRRALETELSAELPLALGPGPGTLSVRAAALNIQPGNPLLFAATYAPYVSIASAAAGVVSGSKVGAADVIVEAEIIDSVTREQYFALIDRTGGSKLRPIRGMSRWKHVEVAFQTWSEKFREAVKSAADSAY